MTRVLGVDTASERPDRGYAIADSGALVWFGSEPPGPDAGPIDVVAGERPWTVRGRGAKLTGERLITFCVNNGFQLRDAWPWTPEKPPLFVLLPVRTWKDLVLRGCAGMPGDVFCANFRQKYAPHVSNHNHLDAMGIALAASRIQPAQLKKFVPKGFLR
jgi:hypothetical protein